MSKNDGMSLGERAAQNLAERKAAERGDLDERIADAKVKAQAAQAEREKAAEALRIEQQARVEAMRAERFDEQYKRPALESWRKSGGTLAEFEEAWPDMRKELLVKAGDEMQRHARRAWHDMSRSNF